MSDPTPGQEARARREAHALLDLAHIGADCAQHGHVTVFTVQCKNLVRHLLAEREKLDAANARADGARAAALREAVEVARSVECTCSNRESDLYTEGITHGAWLAVAALAALAAATPPTSAATTGKERP